MNCIICGKKAVRRFSPDMDIQGIGTCKKHLEDVMLAFFALCQGDKQLYELIIKSIKSKKKGGTK